MRRAASGAVRGDPDAVPATTEKRDPNTDPGVAAGDGFRDDTGGRAQYAVASDWMPGRR
ncbi:MAG: hypothetical protein JO108_25600 [Acidobacteriaceae bacterium]|nr:hypothetical protein [Acidobacteriaceae bacterium]